MTAKQLIQLVLEGQNISNVISGAIFDFAGYMTTRDKTIPVGSKGECSPVVDMITDWSKKRKLDLKNANVEKWHDALEQLINGADINSIIDELTTSASVPGLVKPLGVVKSTRCDDKKRKCKRESMNAPIQRGIMTVAGFAKHGTQQPSTAAKTPLAIKLLKKKWNKYTQGIEL